MNPNLLYSISIWDYGLHHESERFQSKLESGQIHVDLHKQTSHSQYRERGDRVKDQGMRKCLYQNLDKC